ncbi:alpha-amylase, partial [candidate division KSB1 bacterium]|nr:alpha-amylase [candidate division KSB1 bacterium]
MRQYTAAGTFAAFAEHLDRLQEMGVGILWFMPIHPIGQKNRLGSLGSYYSVRNYLDVNPEYGTLDEFKALVQNIHQ